MDIKINYQKSLKLYVARISDGSRYGRLVYGKTPEIVKQDYQDKINLSVIRTDHSLYL